MLAPAVCPVCSEPLGSPCRCARRRGREIGGRVDVETDGGDILMIVHDGSGVPMHKRASPSWFSRMIEELQRAVASANAHRAKKSR